jgi:hypothetical protein
VLAHITAFRFSLPRPNLGIGSAPSVILGSPCLNIWSLMPLAIPFALPL